MLGEGCQPTSVFINESIRRLSGSIWTHGIGRACTSPVGWQPSDAIRDETILFKRPISSPTASAWLLSGLPALGRVECSTRSLRARQCHR